MKNRPGTGHCNRNGKQNEQRRFVQQTVPLDLCLGRRMGVAAHAVVIGRLLFRTVFRMVAVVHRPVRRGPAIRLEFIAEIEVAEIELHENGSRDKQSRTGGGTLCDTNGPILFEKKHFSGSSIPRESARTE